MNGRKDVVSIGLTESDSSSKMFIIELKGRMLPGSGLPSISLSLRSSAMVLSETTMFAQSVG